MPTVSMEKVTRALYVADSEYLENRGETVSYSFARFRNAMLSNDVFSDIRAIRSRWDVLKAKGIITEVGPEYNKALFDVKAFNKAYGYHICTVIPSAGCAHARTHTNDTPVKSDVIE